LPPPDSSELLPALPPGAEVLICRLRSLGDMVLETPALAALHAWRPDLRLCVLAEPWCAPVLDGNPAVAEVVLSGGLAETALRLRRRCFPIFFNQHGGPRSALLAGGSGAPWRVCWTGYQYSFLYNVHVPDREEFFGTAAVHMVEHRLSQFYWTGLPRGPIPRTRVFPQAAVMASVERQLASRGIAPGGAYAVLQPAARTPGMRWPVEKYAALARILREEHSMATVVNLGRRDEELAAEVRRKISGCAVVVDSFTVPELIALLAGARLFVGNDSGPAHVAAAADCPCVVLFGPTNPVEWGPWRARHRVVRASGAASGKSEPPPIRSIAVDEVLAACEQLLAAPDACCMA
jgi:heptosyltransferase III